jgi:hypothetical protein
MSYMGEDRRRRALIVFCVLAVMSFGTGVSLAAAGIGQPAAFALVPGQATEAETAAWIAAQVGSGTTVSCDPAMCAQLRQRGFPAAGLMTLRPSAASPLGSAVVVATPAIRDQFGARLAAAYAPLVIASFGSGADRVDVRAVAPDGAAAFESELAAGHTRLIFAGKELLSNKNLQASAAARTALLAGQADPRLLVTLSALVSEMPLRLVSFDDPSPGASPAVPLRGAEIAATSSAGLTAALAFLHAQQAPYLPAVSAVTGGQSLINVRFDAPGLVDVGGS